MSCIDAYCCRICFLVTDDWRTESVWNSVKVLPLLASLSLPFICIVHNHVLTNERFSDSDCIQEGTVIFPSFLVQPIGLHSPVQYLLKYNIQV